ncbi:hypothetical protein J6590_014577 [Homalodisca vitripennis]|nr:hypothetical protein J6590_014577 [Homalodisca vitripennis]
MKQTFIAGQHNGIAIHKGGIPHIRVGGRIILGISVLSHERWQPCRRGTAARHSVVAEPSCGVVVSYCAAPRYRRLHGRVSVFASARTPH